MSKSVFTRIIASIIMLCLLAGCVSCSSDTQMTGDGTTEEAGGTSEDSSEAVAPGLLRVGWNRDTIMTDVHRVKGSYLFLLNLYDTLFVTRRDDNGDTYLEPRLATDYTVSGDGLTYSFTLRDDVKFCDGTPMTAEDVEYTFTRMLTLPDSVQTDFGESILGAADCMAHKTDKLEGIRVIDDTHIDITLSRPVAGYVQMLAAPSCAVMSKAFTKAAGNRYGTSPEQTCGTGAYMLTEISDSRYVLELNPYYWGDIPSAERIEIYRLEPVRMADGLLENRFDIINSTDISDEIINTISDAEEWSGHTVSIIPMGLNMLFMNMADNRLKDVRIRRAIQHGIDRDAIIREAYGNKAVTIDGLFPRGLYGYSESNEGWLKYDPEEAVRLLTEAGAYGKLELQIAAEAEKGSQYYKILTMIRDNLTDIGINAKLVNYDSKSFTYLRRQGRLEAYLTSWEADYNDPDSFIYTFFGSVENTVSRSLNYSDLTVIGRVGAAKAIMDEPKRLAEYADLEKKIVREDAALVPLVQAEVRYFCGDRISGFTPYWAGWGSLYFKDVELK